MAQTFFALQNADNKILTAWSLTESELERKAISKYHDVKSTKKLEPNQDYTLINFMTEFKKVRITIEELNH